MVNMLIKPWFVYRPSQIVRRLFGMFSPEQQGYNPLRTSWGAEIQADPTKTIGRSILTTGLYDLAVTEVFLRLISPGDTIVDVGANIGYMTVLASIASGSGGKVYSFEPHPELFSVLKENIARNRSKFQMAEVLPYQIALGNEPGTGDLILPDNFTSNDGVAHIGQVPTHVQQRSVSVQIDVLDEIVGKEQITLLKLDVEGFEAKVLQGARKILQESSIIHIVFEDHSFSESEVVEFLRSAGYTLFSLGWSLHGLQVASIEQGVLAKSYEAPNFIATKAPQDVLQQCSRTGWMALQQQIQPVR